MNRPSDEFQGTKDVDGREDETGGKDPHRWSDPSKQWLAFVTEHKPAWGWKYGEESQGSQVSNSP
jgi:hypothetical protein